MIQTGRLIYYGDNKQPGRQLHDTPRFGNSLLRDLFNWAHSRSGGRNRVAPILVFGNAGNYRDVVFLGLAIPGAPDLSSSEDLVAVWKTSNGRKVSELSCESNDLGCTDHKPRMGAGCSQWKSVLRTLPIDLEKMVRYGRNTPTHC